MLKHSSILQGFGEGVIDDLVIEEIFANATPSISKIAEVAQEVDMLSLLLIGLGGLH